MELKKEDIKHHATCNPFYPEKPEGEPPKHIIRVDLYDSYYSLVCGDCGAFVTNLPNEPPEDLLAPYSECKH